MAINWGNIVGNIQDTSGNVASGNQMGPGGPGANTYNPNQSAQNQLAAIVANQQNLQNQAGTPAYAKKGHKFEKFMQVPQGGQMTQAQQAIADFYGPSTPNAYQQAINNFIQSNPANMQVYKDSGLKGAGLNAFMTTVPEAIASKSPIMKGIASVANVFNNLSNAYITGKKKAAAGIDKAMSTTESALNQGVDIFKNAIAEKPKQKGSTFKAQSTPGASPLGGIPSLLNTSTDTAGAERLFKLPPGSGFSFKGQDGFGNYLVNDPRIRSVAGPMTAMNLNQGGLASLNNPEYQRLMSASNFGF
jgi:hypothetical protein